MSSAKELLDAGMLQGAIEVMNGEVKQNPIDVNRRGFLAELLCAGGRFERADAQLEIIAQQDPKAGPGIAIFRQLIRAATARSDFYSAGRLPEFLDAPPPHIQLHLRASIYLRERRLAEAAELLEQAEEARPRAPGTCNGRHFDDLRDIDDMTAAVFEVLTSTGKFYWIPVERVRSIEFRRPERLKDLVWRRAQLSVAGGPEGEVFLPVTYWTEGLNTADSALLGRVTEWHGGHGDPSRGVGQVSFLVGEESMSIMQLETIAFEPHG